MVFLYVKGQGETLFPLGREDPICKGGKKRMKKKALKRIVSLLLGALLLLGCTLPAGAQTTWRNPFTDVKESDWFYPHVQWAAGSGVLSGTSASTSCTVQVSGSTVSGSSAVLCPMHPVRNGRHSKAASALSKMFKCSDRTLTRHSSQRCLRHDQHISK